VKGLGLELSEFLSYLSMTFLNVKKVRNKGFKDLENKKKKWIYVS